MRKRYDSYKDSGVEWIGEIPSHWVNSKFKYLTKKEVQYGVNSSSDNYCDEGIRFIRTTDIDDFGKLKIGGVFIEEDGIDKSQITEEFDFLISRSGTLGRTYLHQSNERMTYGGYLVRFNFGHPSLSKFIQFYCHSSSFWDWISLNTIVSTIGNVNGQKYNNMEVPIPPLSEQQQIVSFLDTKTSLIDSLIEKTKRKIELLKEKRLKLIEEVILNPNNKRVRLKYMVDLVKRPIEREEDNSYTKIGMYNWGRGIFKYPSELGSDLGDSTFNYIKEGDLLLSGQFSWEGSVSLVEKEEDNCISSHRFHILNGQEGKVLNEYLWSYFTSQEGHFLLNENSPGSAGRNRPLNIGKLLKEKIPIPRMEIQMKIKRLVIETNNYEKYSKQRTELLKEYRQSLISEVVTGKLKVTTDE